ncbi:trypsin-3-like [Pomacea canaliculata]|uniref:trypsin-3-like n=1 Tax=Pomacea canaliculata TaxID=400727 RepID=UPI000D72F5F6|nr:trypsin-3-like [Pomacea canaliculata]
MLHRDIVQPLDFLLPSAKSFRMRVHMATVLLYVCLASLDARPRRPFQRRHLRARRHKAAEIVNSHRFGRDIHCGRRPLDTSPLDATVNGWDVVALELRQSQEVGYIPTFGLFPWTVGIADISGQHLCGGVIISERWVISSANCFEERKETDVMLKVGDDNLDIRDEGEQMFEVQGIYMHAAYDPETWDYDLALVKVKPHGQRGIRFDDFVQPACLPSPHTFYSARTKCYISGWETKRTKGNKGGKRTLLAAQIPILPSWECGAIYNGLITPRMLCAGLLTKGMNACSSESGSPLICNIDGVFTVLGVTSWGASCDQTRGSVGVYSSIRDFLPWIISTMEHHYI